MCYATYNKIDILFKINDNDPQLISQVASFLQTKRFLTLIDGTYRTQPAPHSSSRIDKLGSCLLVQELSNKPSSIDILPKGGNSILGCHDLGLL